MEKLSLISIALSLMIIVLVYIDAKCFTEIKNRTSKGSFLIFSFIVCIPFINIIAIFYFITTSKIFISTSKRIKDWLDKPL
jgi:hypothetical protein